MLGERIKRARESAGLNLRDLAAKAGISAMAISKYERDESTPSSGVLLALAQALGVRTEYFFRHTGVELVGVEYREHEKIPDKEEKKVLADVTEQLERWIELEQFLPVPWSIPYALPETLPAKIKTLDEIEDVAIAIRDNWKLGHGPIHELIDVLESKGIKVFITRYDEHKNFNGLTARVNDAPVIVVGKHWPGDRQRFTLAHELGHLVLKGRLAKDLNEEIACHRFAGAFLVPKDQVFSLLGNKRTWLEPQELMILKQDWGLSMAGWSYRAYHLGILTKKGFDEIWSLFRKNGWKEKEPDPQYPNEKTSLFNQLLFRALAEDIIGESKAAELLGMSVMDLHSYRNMESPNAARRQ